MLPHPPKSKKLKDLTSRRGPKFPGTGLPLKGTNVKKGSNKVVSFQTWREPEKMDNRRSSRGKQPRDIKSCEGSFSHYTPLPAIGNQEERQSQSHYNGKRSLPKSAEKLNTGNQNDDVLLSTIKRMKLGMDGMLNSTPSSSSSSSFLSSTVQSTVPNIPVHNIELAIRLPKGSRIHHTFKSSDTLETVMRFLSTNMGVPLPLSKYVIYLNEVPKKELNELQRKLCELNIHDRSVLMLDTRD